MHNEITVMTPPPEGPWMRRLHPDNAIWLVKEQAYGRIVFPWQPPEPGYICGRLVLQYHGSTHVWFVGSEGEGLDGKQLILPCEGHLPEAFADIVEQREADFQMVVSQLIKKAREQDQYLNQLGLAVSKMWTFINKIALEAGIKLGEME